MAEFTGTVTELAEIARMAAEGIEGWLRDYEGYSVSSCSRTRGANGPRDHVLGVGQAEVAAAVRKMRTRSRLRGARGVDYRVWRSVCEPARRHWSKARHSRARTAFELILAYVHEVAEGVARVRHACGRVDVHPGLVETLVHAREGAEHVVALHEERVVRALERHLCRARLGDEHVRVLGEDANCASDGPAGTAVKASRLTPRSARVESTRYAAPSSSRTFR
jgi:hypothetical protein